MKKILSLTLALCVLFGAVSIVSASAVSSNNGLECEVKSGDYWYNHLNDGTVEIARYEGNDSVITVPAEIDGYTVSGIAPVAFGGQGATEVILPDTVTYIGNSAFRAMRQLKSIVIPENVTVLDNEAFSYCTSLTQVTLPESLESIGRNIFYRTPYYDNTENWDNGLLYYGTYLLDSDDSYTDVCVVRDGTTLIAESVFHDNDTISSVHLPEGLKYIGVSSFAGCKMLGDINIPDSVISIGISTFYNCHNLANITLPESLEHIGEYAFEGTAIYNNPENWDNGVLYINNALIKISPDFSGKLEIKEGTYIIASDAADGYGVTRIIMPDSVTVLCDTAFGWCYDLTYVKLSKNLTEIPRGAFRHCSALQSISIPKSVTTIGEYAFDGCRTMSGITIPETVTEIGAYAVGFNDEMPLSDFIIHGKPDTAAEEFARNNNIRFRDTTPQYKDKILELLDIPEEDPENGEGWLAYYHEGYEYYSSQNTYEATPDFVLIEAYENIVGPAFAAELFGDYVLQSHEHHFPATFGYFIYLPAKNEIYSLQKAFDMRLEGVYTVFTKGKLGRLIGDVNNDRNLNIRDATLIQKALAGLAEIENDTIEAFVYSDKENVPTSISDFKRDGKMNIRDATAIQKRIAGLDKENGDFSFLGFTVVQNPAAPIIRKIANTPEELNAILLEVTGGSGIINFKKPLDEEFFKEKSVVVITDVKDCPSCATQDIIEVTAYGATLQIHTLKAAHDGCVGNSFYECSLVEVDKKAVQYTCDIKVHITQDFLY